MRVKLGDICERGTSNLKQSDIVGKTGDYPIYGAAGYIGNVDFYQQDTPYIAVVKDGAGIGRTMLLPEKSSVIGTMQYLVPKKDVLPEYLCYAVQNMHLEKYYTGATIPHIYFRDYKNEEFWLSDKNEQQEIVDILGKIERVISSRKAELKKLDILIKSRFVEMFGSPISNPKGWEKKALKDVCTKLNDGTHFSPESFEYGKYKYITAKNIKLSGFDFSNITYVSEEIHRAIYERCNPEFEDVLYIKDGVTTGIAMVNTLDEEFTLLSSVALLKQDREIIDGYFLCEVLNNEEMYKDIRSNMGGAAITRLTIAKLNKIKVIVPPLELQKQFAAFVHQTDKLKVAKQR
ncbi:MAG: restriction endonuclease subunit S [Clostridium sp.]|nr:restriction endonuclease subunit S [Clostridium sp.]